jgi:hypothetical protein
MLERIQLAFGTSAALGPDDPFDELDQSRHEQMPRLPTGLHGGVACRSNCKPRLVAKALTYMVFGSAFCARRYALLCAWRSDSIRSAANMWSVSITGDNLNRHIMAEWYAAS